MYSFILHYHILLQSCKFSSNLYYCYVFWSFTLQLFDFVISIIPKGDFNDILMYAL